jgi:hypothetical protein
VFSQFGEIKGDDVVTLRRPHYERQTAMPSLILMDWSVENASLRSTLIADSARAAMVQNQSKNIWKRWLCIDENK